MFGFITKAVRFAGHNVSGSLKATLSIGDLVGPIIPLPYVGAGIHYAKLGADRLNKLAALGSRINNGATVFKVGQAQSGNPAGFQAGIGIMATANVTPAHIQVVRQSLTPDQQLAFDMAIAAKLGASIKKGIAPAIIRNDAQKSGYFITIGMADHAPAQKQQVMAKLSGNTDSRYGATVALEELNPGHGKTFWQRVKEFLGIKG